MQLYEQGRVLLTQGQYAEALTLFEAALALDPHSARLHVGLGKARGHLGQIESAIGALRTAIRLAPEDCETHTNLGALLLQNSDFDAAITAFERCVALQPHNAATHFNLGLAYGARGELDRALSLLRWARHLAPEWAEVHYHLAQTLAAVGDMRAAALAYQDAIALKPDWLQAYKDLATVLTHQGRLEAIVRLYEAAVARVPTSSALYVDLGAALCRLDCDARAIEAFHHAIALQPDNWEAHLSLGVLLLTHGHFRDGWREYEWRLCLGSRAARGLGRPLPIWDGGRFAGRTLLLCGEQGYGDRIQFVRFASMVKSLGGSTVVACLPRLARLLATCPGIDRVVSPETSPVDADLQVSLLSLPAVLGITLETLPRTVPYLWPPADTPPALHACLAPHTEQFKIGIAWTGNPRQAMNAVRSCTPGHFAFLSRLPGVRLFSFQVGAPALAADLLEALHITPLAPVLDDFASTAAAVVRMDLIITVDTSLAHLAGALGKPVWTLLAHRADWRWMTARTDSPWYPSMRLFRQPRLHDWQSVFVQVREALERHI
jgi:tetratricopeptide (TPR) repeat protein